MVFCSPWATLLYCSTVFCNVTICHVSFKFDIKKKKKKKKKKIYFYTIVCACPLVTVEECYSSYLYNSTVFKVTHTKVKDNVPSIRKEIK